MTSGPAVFWSYAVDERVDDHVARRHAELREEALQALAGLADEDAPHQTLVRGRILTDAEHARRAVEPAAMKDRPPLGAKRRLRIRRGAGIILRERRKGTRVTGTKIVGHGPEYAQFRVQRSEFRAAAAWRRLLNLP